MYRSLLFLIPSFLFSLPKDPLFIHGQGTASFKQENQCLIEAGDGAIIEWSDFSLGREDQITFSLPGKSSAVLNRVVSDSISHIFGSIESNGQVFLLNPNGILFGRDAVINTAAFYASTLDLQNEVFASGKIRFEGKSLGKILNEGHLFASNGALYLIGGAVENRGSLNTAFGDIGLIAAETCNVEMQPHFASCQLNGEIIHSGTIHAQKGDFGGSVFLVGEQIFLKDHGLIETSSPLGAGNVFVGGGPHGNEPSIPNGRYLLMESLAEIRADALQNGNGGSVVLWGEEACGFFGKISARGGEFGGDGGFVEVSSPGYLSAEGIADRRAPFGNAGTLLFDPCAVTISAAANSGNAFVSPNYTFSGGVANISTVVATTIQTNLSMGNVIVNAAATGTAATGSITVNAAISWPQDTSLTLIADGPIVVNRDIQNSAPTPVVNANITLCSEGQISILGGAVAVAVGSQNGTTQITSLGNLLLTGNPSRATNNRRAQIGFRTPNGLVSTGEINVACNNLVMTSGASDGGVQCSAVRIGHGDDDRSMGVINSRTAGANISICTRGNISMLTQGRNNPALIGHGAYRLNAVGGIAPDQDGNITIQCNGSLVMNLFTPFDPLNNPVLSGWAIGHGSFNTAIGAGPFPNFSGNIDIRTGGDITMNTTLFTGGNQCTATIGHYGSGDNVNLISGDIDIFCGGNLTMTDHTGMSQNNTNGVIIGHFPTLVQAPLVNTLDGDIRIEVAGNIFMSGFDNLIQIGFRNDFSAADMTTCIGDVSVVAANIQMEHFGEQSPSAENYVTIGYRTNVIGDNKAFVATSGDFDVYLDEDLTVMGIDVIGGILANGSVTLAVGGDITLTNLGDPIGAVQDLIVIGPANPSTATTTIFCGGSLICPTPEAPINLGFGNISLPLSGSSLIIRAAGDIQLPNSFTTTTGTIFIEADTSFGTGELWRYSGTTPGCGTGTIAEICNVSLLTPLPSCGVLCQPCVSNFPICPNCSLPSPSTSLSAPLSANSLPIALNGRGSISVLTHPALANHIDLITTTGPITLHSAPRFADGTFSSITFGPTDAIFLGSQSGSIEVFGTQIPGQCERTDAFLNVTINQNICTTGSVLIAANNNMTMNAGSSIGGAACGALIPSSVTLIVDNQFPFPPFIGPGSFTMIPNSSITTTGLLTIYTARQGLNSIPAGCTLNALNFTPGTLFQNTTQEVWCTYYCSPLPGIPFTIAYKDCLQQLTQQSMLIVDQLLANLHPYNEYPGWVERFLLIYEIDFPDTEPYFLRRRQINLINHPKTWSVLTPE